MLTIFMPLLSLPVKCFSSSLFGCVSFFSGVFTLLCACLFFTRFTRGSSSELGSGCPERKRFKSVVFYKIHFNLIPIDATVPLLFPDAPTWESTFALSFFFLAIRCASGRSSSSELLSEDEHSFHKLALKL